jgi:hypothetical protein
LTKGLQRRDRDPLQLAPLPPQLRGTNGDLFLEPLVEVLLLDHAVATPDGPKDGAGQVAQIDRLGEVVHRATLHAKSSSRGVVDRGEHEDGDRRLDLDHLGHQVDPAPARHPHVQQHAGNLLPL